MQLTGEVHADGGRVVGGWRNESDSAIVELTGVKSREITIYASAVRYERARVVDCVVELRGTYKAQAKQKGEYPH